MDSKRRCTRNSCDAQAVATLTYSYQDSTIVVGPISRYAEPHTYDLCGDHADRVNPPRGWDVLRLDYQHRPQEDIDDLLALADAVRAPRAVKKPLPAYDPGEPSADATTPSEDSLPTRPSRPPLQPPVGDPGISRGHLRLIRD